MSLKIFTIQGLRNSMKNLKSQCIQLAAQKAEEDEKTITFNIHGAGKLTFKKI